MNKLALAAAVIALSASPALGQGTVQQERCWLGNMGYSPGATIRSGNTVMACTSEYTWEDTNFAASGCVLEGRFYSVGGIDNGPNASAIKQICLADGTWEQVE